ncbi:Vacuolar protein sorting-associated protein 20 [Entomophthora muscae]|uniref:Vacuolar protein sorting-associated protein 20 n=1 Tax=Entomophthora muscae TaxID=34485 RepID=A0ACC2U5P7_9FUNG|nr:Vacuolar protein sorting-associated protein 20 [Entomophthora muscae]
MGSATSKNTVKLNKHDTTLIEMKTKTRQLKSFNRNLDEKISAQNRTIKALAAEGKQSSAINALKYKKTLEAAKAKSESSLFNLKELIDSVELAQLEAEIFKSLEKGSQTLQEIQKEMPIDKVERLMDDIANGVAQQKDISFLLGENSLDDESLLEELEALESEILQELKTKFPDTPANDKVSAIETPTHVSSNEQELDLPDVPTTNFTNKIPNSQEAQLEPALSN